MVDNHEKIWDKKKITLMSKPASFLQRLLGVLSAVANWPANWQCVHSSRSNATLQSQQHDCKSGFLDTMVKWAFFPLTINNVSGIFPMTRRWTNLSRDSPNTWKLFQGSLWSRKVEKGWSKLCSTASYKDSLLSHVWKAIGQYHGLYRHKSTQSWIKKLIYFIKKWLKYKHIKKYSNAIIG